MYDVIVIGAGVSGCAVAKELSKYDIKVLVIEKASDVCEGTSKANSGIVHSGFDAIPGTLKAKLNVLGNERMEQLTKDLDIPYIRNGSLVICHKEEEILVLKALQDQGLRNGVKGLQILNKEEVKEKEPNISEEVFAALYAPTGGIVCPFTLTIALAEIAYENGVEFWFNTMVSNIKRGGEELTSPSFYNVYTSQGSVSSKIVINAAGVYADVLNNMVSEEKLYITPRRGEYCLYDKVVGAYVSHTIFQVPSKFGKGVVVTPTVHGNLMIGPTVEEITNKEDVSTSSKGISEVLSKANLSITPIPNKQIIASFSGLRAHEVGGDFIIGEARDAKGFINVAGIESPGLSCAPIIGEMVVSIIAPLISLKEKLSYKSKRIGAPNIADLSKEEYGKLMESDRSYANVICRCEMVTEGEIKNAIHRPLGATTLDGIKRRTRAGAGRCQSGFCSPKIVQILEKELNKNIKEITKFGGQSVLITGENKFGLLLKEGSNKHGTV